MKLFLASAAVAAMLGGGLLGCGKEAEKKMGTTPVVTDKKPAENMPEAAPAPPAPPAPAAPTK